MQKITHPDPGIAKAAEAVGTIAELARKLGISRSAIHQWSRVPAERVVEVERATGVPRAQLRPDLFQAAPPLAPDNPDHPTRTEAQS